MILIGLAGGSGSGKSTVLELLSLHNILPINTDQIYHTLISTDSRCLSELRDEFGAEVITADGVLDRKRLASIVFNDTDKLARLNTIAHYHVLNTVRDIINDASSKGFSGAVVDAPLLFESGFDKECDVVISVLADEAIRLERIIARDGISATDAKRRIDSQLSDSFLRTHSHHIIVNNGSIAELKLSVEALWNKIVLNYK